MTTQPTAPKSDLRVIVIGAGMSGLLAAIKLAEAGIDFAIVEKADRLGGTWRENTYAGIACDVPSHFYSYSFALNPEWTREFSPGAEIQAYFENAAERFGVADKIQYGKDVARAAFEDGRWQIEMSDGSHEVGDFVIAATGVLHHPNYPNIPGLDSFGGAAFHSARWNHEVDLAGKRVAVIGTGSSAIQIVSAIADEVARLELFQRTPQWVIPVANNVFTEKQKAEFRRNPEAIQAIRAEVATRYTEGFANVLSDAKNPMIQAIHAACEANLEDSVKDPVLKEKLRPTYQAACKRLIMSDTFYDAVQRPNADVVTDSIERAEKAGLRTKDGTLHELDVIVMATGFRVDQFVRPMKVTGRGGMKLDDVWQQGPFAYMALAVPDFPNFFMLQGPNGPVGNFSLIEVAELQVGYVLQVLERIRTGECHEIAPSQQAMRRFDEERRVAAKSTIWATGCKSWYLDSSGLPTAWPFTFDRFREEMTLPRLGDYEMR